MLTAVVLSGLAAGLPTGNTPSVATLKIRSNEGVSAHDLERRDNHELGLNATGLYYTANLTLGTPPYEKMFKIDTGSSDIMVNADDSPLSPNFDIVHSSSFRRMFPALPFQNDFSDGTTVKGFWAAEKFSLFNNTHTFPSQLGIAVEGNGTNTLGLGPMGDEALVFAMSSTGQFYPTYPNLLQTLKQRNIIERSAFSLWLEGAFHENDGLLFGGIDQSKYTNGMFVVPMRDLHSMKYGHPPRKLAIELDHIQTVSPSSFGASTINMPVILDSGNPISQLPSSVVDELATMLDATKSEDLDLYLVDCNLSGNLTFTFSGASISFPASDFVTPWTNNLLPPGQCVLPIKANDDESEYSLGNTFLRNVYAVFDLESYEVGLAKALKASEANLFSSIEPLTNGIPNATKAPNY